MLIHDHIQNSQLMTILYTRGGSKFMPTQQYEGVRTSINTSIKNNERYEECMRNAFIFICELFLLWQLLIYGVAKSSSIPTTIIGIVMLVCTYITLRIYGKTTDELEKHSQILLSTPNSCIDANNLYNFSKAATKCEVGRKSILVMNIVSSLYVLIFSIATLVIK